MSSGIEMEEFMESEHSGIFRVEMVTKTVVLGSLGTHFVIIGVNLNLLPDRFYTLILLDRLISRFLSNNFIFVRHSFVNFKFFQVFQYKWSFLEIYRHLIKF